MISRASKRFWRCFDSLPERTQHIARKNFEIWEKDPWHPSLQFKEVKPKLWSVRIGLSHRALAVFDSSCYIWFWIGSHDEYQRLIDSP